MAEKAIEQEISVGIVDYLLRQPVADHIINAVAAVLPVPEDNVAIQKLSLLRKIRVQVAAGSVSEELLGSLEKMAELELDHSLLESLKRAYCAVAVDCTLRCLRNCPKGEFFEVVKRVWGGRVGRLLANGGGLVSDELLGWKLHFEGGARDKRVDADADAVGRVRVYLKEERSRMGPSCLELLVEDARRRKESVLAGERKRKRKREGDENDPDPDPDPDLGQHDGNQLELGACKQSKKKSKWSVNEECALQEGVNKFGEGSWKNIQHAFSHRFNGRSAADLKDKWRNMNHVR